MIGLPPGALEDLQYRVELWDERGAIERVLAMTVRADIGHAAFDVAKDLYPGREVTLRLGIQVIRTTKD